MKATTEQLLALVQLIQEAIDLARVIGGDERALQQPLQMAYYSARSRAGDALLQERMGK